MQKELKNRIERNAKALRFISRAEMFQKNRKNQKQQLSYLRSLSEHQRLLIIQSLNGPLPNVLPPLSAATISYYRRSNRPVFRTKQNDQLHPHLIYQSLFLISAIEQINFSDYQSIVKQFQTDLQKYLSCQFHQIKQMAIIAAGNKIIGRQKQIQKIVQLDQKQIWVLINHIYERKISYIKIFSYLKDYNQTIYKSLFQMSNTNDDDIIQYIMSDNEIILFLILSLDHYNPDIRKYTIRILGNIMAQKQQYVYKLSNYNIINRFGSFLTSNDEQLRKDVCWALANLAYEKDHPHSQLKINKLLLNYYTCLIIKFKSKSLLNCVISLPILLHIHKKYMFLLSYNNQLIFLIDPINYFKSNKLNLLQYVYILYIKLYNQINILHQIMEKTIFIKLNILVQKEKQFKKHIRLILKLVHQVPKFNKNYKNNIDRQKKKLQNKIKNQLLYQQLIRIK